MVPKKVCVSVLGSKSIITGVSKGIPMIWPLGASTPPAYLVPPGKIVQWTIDVATETFIYAFDITEVGDQNKKLYVVNNLGNSLIVQQPIIGASDQFKMGWFYPPDSQGFIKCNVGKIFDNILKTIFIKP